MTSTDPEWKRPFLQGLQDIAPLALGVAIYGMAFGVLAARAGMDGLGTGVMGAIVFAGSSQIIAVERLSAGAGAAAAVAAGLALNLRLLLITASLRTELAGRPWWQILLGVHLSSDENWALMHATRARRAREAEAAERGETRRSDRVDVGYWYFIGGGAGLMAVWVGSTVLGVSVALGVPDPQAYGLDFAFTAAFIAILRSLWRGLADLLPWIGAVAATVSLSVLTPIDPVWALAAGGVGGALVAGLASRADA